MKTKRENRKQFFSSRNARVPLLYREYRRCIVFGGRRFACEICYVIYRRDERVPCQMCRITITVFIEGRKKIYIISYCSSSRFRLLRHDDANKLRRARTGKNNLITGARSPPARPPAHTREPSTTLRLFRSLMAFMYAYHFSPNGYDDTHDDTPNTCSTSVRFPPPTGVFRPNGTGDGVLLLT